MLGIPSKRVRAMTEEKKVTFDAADVTWNVESLSKIEFIVVCDSKGRIADFEAGEDGNCELSFVKGKFMIKEIK